MMGVEIPVIETERLRLRAPRMEDFESFATFIGSDRAAFVGGPVAERTKVIRAFGHLAGLWVLRGYSCFVAEAKDDGRAVGHFGLWYPLDWPEPEFAWSVWRGADEGIGFAAEALRAVMPWSFERAGIETAISVIDADNHASRKLAIRLGARVDAGATLAANTEGSPFYDADEAPVAVYRHSMAAGMAA